LASEAYLHFTSPIRRYPDLVVHRIVHAALDLDERARRKELARHASREELEQAALASSTAERRAMEVEREILDIYRCFFMIDRIGERFEGTVSAFVGSGAFVTLDDPFVDVLVRTEDLGPDYVIEDDGLTATSPRGGEVIHLGDRILVEIADVAILRRQIQARRVRGEAGVGDERRFAQRGRKDHGRAGGDGRGKQGRGDANRSGAKAKRHGPPSHDPRKGGGGAKKSDGGRTHKMKTKGGRKKKGR
jgi:ribonuclease R